MSGRNGGERFAAPQMPEELRQQLMAANITTQQTSYQTPTEIVELPSRGMFYPVNHPLHNVETVEIKFMTTKEEDILTSPTLVEKGVVFDKLLESIIVDKRIDVSSLVVGDRSAILSRARISAYGPEYSFITSCPACSTTQKIDHLFTDLKNKELSLDKMEIEDGLLKLTLPKSGAVVHLKLLNGRDEKEMSDEQRRRIKANLPEEQLILMYRKLIARVNGNDDMFAIANFVSTMPVLDSRYLRKTYSELKPDLDLTYHFVCKKCGHDDNGGVVSITGDFFWPEL
jgi:hypothetical protein